MINNDGCYREGQSAATRYLLSRDRGHFIRTQERCLELAQTWFREVNAHLREDVLRIPYTTLFLECARSAASDQTAANCGAAKFSPSSTTATP